MEWNDFPSGGVEYSIGFWWEGDLIKYKKLGVFRSHSQATIPPKDQLRDFEAFPYNTTLPDESAFKPH